jgi:hypothetical protein
LKSRPWFIEEMWIKFILPLARRGGVSKSNPEPTKGYRHTKPAPTPTPEIQSSWMK